MKLTDEQLQSDIEFLANRAKKAGCMTFTNDRATGTSSNAIVSLAYLGEPARVLPMDGSDLAACENMWAKLPTHRKTADVMAAMENARSAI